MQVIRLICADRRKGRRMDLCNHISPRDFDVYGQKTLIVMHLIFLGNFRTYLYFLIISQRWDGAGKWNNSPCSEAPFFVHCKEHGCYGLSVARASEVVALGEVSRIMCFSNRSKVEVSCRTRKYIHMLKDIYFVFVCIRSFVLKHMFTGYCVIQLTCISDLFCFEYSTLSAL